MAAAISQKTFATAADDGTVDIVWRQLNAGSDGGGPGTAFIDTTGTGNAFKPLTITKNFADGGEKSDNPMTVQLPAGTTCTGGSDKSTCLARVQNPAGPFGSCMAIKTAATAAGGAVDGTAVTGNASTATVPATAKKATPVSKSSRKKKGGPKRIPKFRG
ncbi:uncharacterized protein MELLADRAFT_88803 [Melampsora larici-populina 98AG31]|uniref:Secreted protein n=1 Tax=Melampsora larici-populina (strain 98AG31 / pathotype 3-4-7) TaxID=747676 RepID=F4RT15_MELLP|nr:uncharacterized protein MELLADRAFT_88803 [Melampsora larici-populina 98AG31]EGG04508.1 hypothetical protein MELLADRAFT_88803 [Melampsora larici-populina 98AG31]